MRMATVWTAALAAGIGLAVGALVCVGTEKQEPEKTATVVVAPEKGQPDADPPSVIQKIAVAHQKPAPKVVVQAQPKNEPLTIPPYRDPCWRADEYVCFGGGGEPSSEGGGGKDGKDGHGGKGGGGRGDHGGKGDRGGHGGKGR